MFKNSENIYSMIVDIGNTDIVCALFEEENIILKHRLKTDLTMDISTYHSLILRGLADYDLPQIRHIGLGSVVPEITLLMRDMFAQYYNAEVYEIDGLSELSLSYEIESRKAAGADLVANALAANKIYQMNCIVVDMGTSTTFQLVSKDAVYKGLIIAPGLKSSGDTLIQKAARLQDIELTNPTKLLGLNTKESMLSGIVGSHIRMIESTVWEICKEYHEMAPFKVIITGGLAALIEPLIPHGYAYEPDLTLKGLNYALAELIERGQ